MLMKRADDDANDDLAWDDDGNEVEEVDLSVYVYRTVS